MWKSAKISGQSLFIGAEEVSGHHGYMKSQVLNRQLSGGSWRGLVIITAISPFADINTPSFISTSDKIRMADFNSLSRWLS